MIGIRTPNTSCANVQLRRNPGGQHSLQLIFRENAPGRRLLGIVAGDDGYPAVDVKPDVQLRTSGLSVTEPNRNSFRSRSTVT